MKDAILCLAGVLGMGLTLISVTFGRISDFNKEVVATIAGVLVLFSITFLVYGSVKLFRGKDA